MRVDGSIAIWSYENRSDTQIGKAQPSFWRSDLRAFPENVGSLCPQFEERFRFGFDRIGSFAQRVRANAAIADFQKFAKARAPSPAREARALPRQESDGDRPPLLVHKKSPATCFQVAGFWRCPTLARPIVARPSGLQRFTSVFGMGTGGSTALISPEIGGAYATDLW